MVNKNTADMTNSSNNNNKKRSDSNDKLSTLYDEELANILHEENLFGNTETMLPNESHDIPSQIQSAPISNNNNNNKKPTNDIGDIGDIDTINIINPSFTHKNNNTISDNNDIPHPIKRADTTRSNTNSITTDNTSSGTIEDIINPSFMKPTNLNNNNNNNKERSLMLARDAKANIRNLMRRGSPLGLFNSEHLMGADPNNILSGNNDINRNTTPLYSTNIIRNNAATTNRNFNAANNTSTNNNDHSNKQPNSTSSNNRHNYNQPIQRRHTPHKTRPAFVNKLWSMVNDINNMNLIQWAEDGKSFIVTNRESFVHNILPRYFKHSNFASFVRQLNMYGWHKVQDVRSGSIQGSSDDRWQFANENFQRDREDLLINIVRQRGSSNNSHNNHNHSNNVQMPNDINRQFIEMNNGNNTNNYPNYNVNQRLLQNIENDSNTSNNKNNNNNNYQLPGNLNPRATLHITNGPESIQIQNNIATVLNELEQIKYNQIAISKDLLRINKDNDLLWKENMMARERYRSQQQILEKIFRFMAAMMPHMDQKMIMDGMMDTDKGQINQSTIDSGINMNPQSNITMVNENRNNSTTTTATNTISNNSNNTTAFRNNSININDRNNSTFNNMINYPHDGEIISPSANSIDNNSNNNGNNSKTNNNKNRGIYLETLEDVDNSPPGSMSTSRSDINNRRNNTSGNINERLLLKNKINSPEAADNNTNYQPHNFSNNTYQTPINAAAFSDSINNNYARNNSNTAKISELPFSDEEAISPVIQEINSNSTSPQLNVNSSQFDNVTNKSNNNNNTNNNRSTTINSPIENIPNEAHHFNHLQNNINEQDNRIRHLENMLTQLTPKLMSPLPTTNGKAIHTQRTNIVPNSPNQINHGVNEGPRLSHDYSSNNPIIDNKESNADKNDLFNFQDYFTQGTTPRNESAAELPPMPAPPPILSGLTPLMMEDPSLLMNPEENSNYASQNNSNGNPMNDYSIPQIEELSELQDIHNNSSSNNSNSNKRPQSPPSYPDLNAINNNNKRQKK